MNWGGAGGLGPGTGTEGHGGAYVGAREDGEEQARVLGLVRLRQVHVPADRVAEVHLPVPQQLHCTPHTVQCTYVLYNRYEYLA